MLNPCASRLHLWSAKTNWTLKMKHLAPQCPSILVIYCFCMLQIPSSGFPRPLANAPDGSDITKLEQLAYWATLSRQPKFILMHMSENNCPKIGKDNQDIYKRFLFHYSRTQKPTLPVKSGFPPVHPLMRLASQLANQMVKRFSQQRDPGTAVVNFTKKDHTAPRGRPFFLFRPRNGRNTEDNTH